MALRAGLIGVLAIVAVVGAAIAAVEKAVAPQSAATLATASAHGAPPTPAAVRPAPPLPGGAVPGAAVPGAAVPGGAAPGAEVPGAPVPGLSSGAPGSALALPSNPALPAPCPPPVRICVQLSTSSAWLRTDTDGVRGPVPIRHGRPDSPTPVGRFPIEAKDRAHVNTATGSPMPFSLFFDRGFAVYQADLSAPSSGSVRVAPGAAEAFFTTASVGDLVEVVP